MAKSFSLSALLKKQKTLVTDLGEFEYVKQIGEGGNSLVFLFEKSAQSFAVKFLKLSEATKEKRFKDEYFCSMQMASHKNVVELYHFDKVVVSSTDYFVIFMKHYEGVLKDPLIGKTDKEKAEYGWKLFEDLSAALAHLHKHRVIHRDIKPQNIFISQSNEFVLGDLGIAHFPDELFPKLSKTANSDRMANFMFSAPEQSEVGSNVTEAADIYSLGQVLQWYLSGKTVRGTGRTSIGTSTSPEELKTLDAVINKCMRNNSAERFQSIAEIVKFIKEQRSPKKKDPWEEIHNFDDAIRKSFTTMRDYYESSAQNEITDFVSNFQQSCSSESFYWVDSDGGSFHYCPMRPLPNDHWLFNEEELKIEKMLVYRHATHYKSCVVLITAAMPPFLITDVRKKTTKVPEQAADEDLVYATLWGDMYVDSKETDNGYFNDGEQTIKVTSSAFDTRCRRLKRHAYIVAPFGHGAVDSRSDPTTEKFLQTAIRSNGASAAIFKTYLNSIHQFFDPTIVALR